MSDDTPEAVEAAPPNRRRWLTPWLREFLSELVTIVLGVVIGITGSQLVEDWQNGTKLRAVQAAMDDEVHTNLFFASEQIGRQRCARAFLDRLEAATVAGDHAQVLALLSGPRPFRQRPWNATGWQAVLSTGITDKLPRDRLGAYARLFADAEWQRVRQSRMQDNLAEISVARFDLPGDAGSRRATLVAIARLRSDIALSTIVSTQMIDVAGKRIGVTPGPKAKALLVEGKSSTSDCARQETATD